MKDSAIKNSLFFQVIIKSIIIISLVSNFTFAEDGEWKEVETTNSPTERAGASFVSHPDGKAVLFGGEGPHVDLLNDLYVFQEYEWTEEVGDPNNQPPERKNAASWAGENKLYIHGGEGAGGEILDDMWIYDFYVNQWNEVELGEPNPGPLTRHSAAPFDDGKVLISGGMSSENIYSFKTYIYDPVTNTFEQKQNIPFPTSEQSIKTVGDEAFPLQVFGENQEMVFYNRTSEQWSYYLPDQGSAHPGLMAAAAYCNALDRGLYVIGGQEYHDGVGYENTKSVWMFNVEDKSWSEIAALPGFRLYSGAVYDPLGDRLLLFGGKDENGDLQNTTYEYEFNPTSVNDRTELAKEFKLEQNYPNPFNPATTIKFSIPQDVRRETSNVKLIVYDLLGREMETLLNKKLNPGEYEIEFAGETLSSGIYFYKLTAGGFSQTRKMILIK